MDELLLVDMIFENEKEKGCLQEIAFIYVFIYVARDQDEYHDSTLRID